MSETVPKQKIPDLKEIPAAQFFTRVKVTRYKKAGSDLLAIPDATNRRKRKDVDEYSSRALVDRALDKVGQFINNSSNLNNYGGILVRDAKSTMEEYKIAKNWNETDRILSVTGIVSRNA